VPHATKSVWDWSHVPHGSGPVASMAVKNTVFYLVALTVNIHES